MARGVNKVILVGNLGNDPDVKYTQGGSAITTISVATTEAWKDKQSGEQQERTEWHRVKFFGRLAEIAGEYLKKGRQVYIEGSLRTDKYTDKEGIERYSTDIIANELQMLGGGGEGGSRGGGQQQDYQDRGQAPQRQWQRQPQQRQSQGGYQQQERGYGNGGTGNRSGAPHQPRRQAAQQAHRQPEPAYDGGEDDIPFARNDGMF